MRIVRFGLGIGICLLFYSDAAAKASETVRIVSLSPAITAMLHELNAEKTLVGITRYCAWSDEARDVARVGGALDPELESILKVEPDMVLAGSLLPAHAQKKIERFGIQVETFRQNRIADVLEQILWLGDLVGQSEFAKTKVLEANELLAAIQLSSNKPRSAIIAFADSLQIVAGTGTYGSEVLKNAGFVNVAESLKLPWPTISKEWLLRNDPEWIVLASHIPGQAKTSFRQRCLNTWKRDPVLRALQAVQKGQVLVIPDNQLGIPSLKLVEAVYYLRSAYQLRLEEGGVNHADH
ncbi:MAG: helical backbone metal receptor [Verrucomicrobiota bacterium]